MKFALGGRLGPLALGLAIVLTVSTASGQKNRFELFEKKTQLTEEQETRNKTVPSTSRERIPLDGRIDPGVYRLGPGDEVDISVWSGESYRSLILFVSAEGRLLVPPAGPLDVSGMTLAEADSFVNRQLSVYLSEGRVSLSLINPRLFRTFAVGAVGRPGTYVHSAVDRVSDVVESAGGIKPGGSRRRVRLLTSGRQPMAEADLMRYAAGGDISFNPRVEDGCIVEVPTIENYVMLRGNFPNLAGTDSVLVSEQNKDEINQYVVEFLPGESLNDLFRLVGRPELFTVPADGRMFESKDGDEPTRYAPLTPELMQSELVKGTVYEFPVQNRWVFVTGNVNKAGRYVYRPGWTVIDYLGQAGGPNWNGSNDVCYLRRADGTKHKSGPKDEVVPGDVLFVPEKPRVFERAVGPLVGLIGAIIYVVFK
jgi:protein involved in polysaccharide export with SLBB domain